MQDGYDSLIRLLLPDFILDFFEMKGVRKEDDIFHFDLEEVNVLTQIDGDGKLQSKGFFPTITVQDFPIRGHKVFLHIKHRRWLNTSTGKVAYRDWSIVAEGTRITEGSQLF